MFLDLQTEHNAVIDSDVSIKVCESECDTLCSPDASVRERRQKDKEDRLSLVLWRRPVTTLQYFLLETLIKLKEWTLK